jgi:hypothetical protein
MKTHILAAAALVLGALSAAPASAAISKAGIGGPSATVSQPADPSIGAVTACLNYNKADSQNVLDVTDDGYDGFVVWIDDGNDGMWLCDATADGAVYANLVMRGDLLNGAGPDLIGITDVSASVDGTEGQLRAENICLAVTDADDASVIATVEDAMGDYLVWIDAFGGELSMCNASAFGEVFAYVPVDMPINPWAIGNLTS